MIPQDFEINNICAQVTADQGIYQAQCQKHISNQGFQNAQLDVKAHCGSDIRREIADILINRLPIIELVDDKGTTLTMRAYALTRQEMQELLVAVFKEGYNYQHEPEKVKYKAQGWGLK